MKKVLLDLSSVHIDFFFNLQAKKRSPLFYCPIAWEWILKNQFWVEGSRRVFGACVVWGADPENEDIDMSGQQILIQFTWSIINFSHKPQKEVLTRDKLIGKHISHQSREKQKVVSLIIWQTLLKSSTHILTFSQNESLIYRERRRFKKLK